MAQVVERGYAVSEVAERLRISTKSLYTWRAQFTKAPRLRAEDSEQAAEVKRLKRELARVTKERNILKKAALDSIDQRNTLSIISLGDLNLNVFRGRSFHCFAKFSNADWEC